MSRRPPLGPTLIFATGLIAIAAWATPGPAGALPPETDTAPRPAPAAIPAVAPASGTERHWSGNLRARTSAPRHRAELAPAYSGARGSATWCAPTPRYCGGWGGNAHVGAMRSFRWGDTPYTVVVSWHGRSTVVRVVSYCECPNTLIDLSPSAFDDLAPLSRGRLRGVIVEGFDIPHPPRTDAE